MRTRLRISAFKQLDGALELLPPALMEHARWVSRTAAVLALIAIVAGLATGAITLRYAWLHVLLVFAAAIGTLMSARAAQGVGHPTGILVTLPALIGALLPWNASAVSFVSTGLPALAAACAALALALEGAARRVGVVIRLSPAKPATTPAPPATQATPQAVMSAQPRAGWYPDPVEPETLRWWDGGAWTADRRQLTA